MKKMFMCAALFLSVVFGNAAPNADKIEKAFSASFPTATDVSWHKDGDLTTVRFTKDKIISELTYDTEAHIVKSVRYYYEENLPAMIVSRLKTKYAGKKVFGVTEVINESKIEYHIVLEDEVKWYNIVSDHYGHFTLNSKFKKA